MWALAVGEGNCDEADYGGKKRKHPQSKTPKWHRPILMMVASLVSQYATELSLDRPKLIMLIETQSIQRCSPTGTVDKIFAS